MHNQLEPSPIIIFGAPRSGTTYLGHILDHHPEVCISNEIRLFAWAHKSLNVLTQQDQALLGHRETFVKHLRSCYPELIRSFYKKLAPQARYWGDKNPHYADRQNKGCLDTIADLFPETRFIHIIRDGRDVVSSLLKKNWANFEEAHRLWLDHIDIGCEFGRERPAWQYFELRYEDLIEDDLGVVRQLLDFLGIEMHERVEEFCRQQRASRVPLSAPTRDLTDVTSSEWSRLLDSRQQFRSLELLGSHLIGHGYETETSFLQRYLEVSQRCGREIIYPLRPVAAAVPQGSTVVVISRGDDELMKLDGRKAWHFPQTEDGTYAGHYPADSTEAIAHLEALRARGGEFLLIPHTAYWWLTSYSGFGRHLQSLYPRVSDHDAGCLIYDLRHQPSVLPQEHASGSAAAQPRISDVDPTSSNVDLTSSSGELLRSNGDLLKRPPSRYFFPRVTQRRGSVTFTCNICGGRGEAFLERLDREGASCKRCGSSVRWRSIVHVLSMELFGESLALEAFPRRPDIKGLGMTDWDGYAGPLARTLGYTNTFYHTEPKFDITSQDLDPAFTEAFDFVICSDVIEHVAPPVSVAFENMRRLLKPNGVLVFSVPYDHGPEAKEHFPDLYDYQVLQRNGHYFMENTTRDGSLQVFDNLVFHGGPGTTLEMRLFSEASLMREFHAAGLGSVKIYRDPVLERGIYCRRNWPRDRSFPMAVRPA